MPERILLVDDDVALLSVMDAYLKRQGYAVTAFSDGHLALASMDDRQPYAVLVTDLDMPKMHGQDLLRLARQRDPRLEVVVVTGNGTVPAAVTALRADGSADFWISPFEERRTVPPASKSPTLQRTACGFLPCRRSL